MTNLRYQHGFTDHPPTTLSGQQLFREWLLFGHVKNPCDNRPYEYKAKDGSFILWSATLDFDYEMGYLLEVRDPEDHTSDFLFCYQRHGGATDITTEWVNNPRPIFGNPDNKEWHWEASQKWVNWVFDTFR